MIKQRDKQTKLDDEVKWVGFGISWGQFDWIPKKNRRRGRRDVNFICTVIWIQVSFTDPKTTIRVHLSPGDCHSISHWTVSSPVVAVSRVDGVDKSAEMCGQDGECPESGSNVNVIVPLLSRHLMFVIDDKGNRANWLLLTKDDVE